MVKKSTTMKWLFHFAQRMQYHRSFSASHFKRGVDKLVQIQWTAARVVRACQSQGPDSLEKMRLRGRRSSLTPFITLWEEAFTEVGARLFSDMHKL